MQNYHVVERKGFREILQMFDPKYKLGSRKHFIDVEIPKLFTEVKCKVLHCLSDHVEYFATKTDLWPNTANHPYLTPSPLRFWNYTTNITKFRFMNHSCYIALETIY